MKKLLRAIVSRELHPEAGLSAVDLEEFPLFGLGK
jgi:hypothetical protein